MIAAVLTGDLIASRAASPKAVDASMSALDYAADALGDVAGFNPRFTRHRGDGWQVAMPLPGPLLDLTLAMLACLTAAETGLKTRAAIGIGPVATLGTSDLSDGAGAAFTTSGDLLEALGERSTQTMMIDGAGVTGWMRSNIAMVDWIAQSWTAGQAEAVLQDLTHTDHTNAQQAKALGISRQSYERRLRGSGLHAMTPARVAFGTHIWT